MVAAIYGKPFQYGDSYQPVATKLRTWVPTNTHTLSHTRRFLHKLRPETPSPPYSDTPTLAFASTQAIRPTPYYSYIRTPTIGLLQGCEFEPTSLETTRQPSLELLIICRQSNSYHPTPARSLSETAMDAATRNQRGGDATRPESVFRIQVSRHVKQLEYQWSMMRHGRKETFPYDFSCDLLANAENNVQSCWFLGGTWSPEWGRSWPSGTKGRTRDPEAFRGPYTGESWPHEVYRDAFYGLDLAASRPSGVFRLQWEEEFRWFRDEVEFRSLEINEQQIWHGSFLAIKESWIQNNIWDPRWSERPGYRWMHECDEEAAGNLGPIRH